jgi:ABC-type sugar transport system substrate-binding protein
MRKVLLASACVAIFSGVASAETIGVSMALFDDNFLTVLRNGMQEHAKTLDGVTLQVEDAQNDVGKQLNQIENFVASGVDAIIVNPVDTDATVAMTAAAQNAGISLVYVNRQPVNLDGLPDKQAFVASDEKESGTLETREVCRLLKEQGKTEAKAVVLMGELSNQAARMRTQDIKDVLATPECSFISIAQEQTANWSRTQGADLVSNWLAAGADVRPSSTLRATPYRQRSRECSAREDWALDVALPPLPLVEESADLFLHFHSARRASTRIGDYHARVSSSPPRLHPRPRLHHYPPPNLTPDTLA